MTATINETDTDWLTLIDFEADVACDYNQIEECNLKVEWKLTNLCCGRYVVLCTPHKDYELDAYNQYDSYSCTWCRRELHKIKIEAL